MPLSQLHEWVCRSRRAALTCVSQVWSALRALIKGRESATNAGLRIILVEDDPLDYELIQASLRTDMNCQVTVVTKRTLFLAELDQELPDAIISDSNIPGLDSMALLAFVQEKYPRIPFIFCSGNESPAFRALVTTRGANAYVSKNDLPRLVEVVKRVCSVEEGQSG